MAETSQSAMRVISLVLFTALFAGAWANDQPRERMAEKTQPEPTAILSQEAQESELSRVAMPTEVMPNVPELPAASAVVDVPALEELKPVAVGMTMTISVETEGLTLVDETVQDHIQRLPLGIANGDYLMVDPLGGVGWLRIRGQQQKDSGEMILKTSIDESVVRYIRVTPVNAGIPIPNVPTPIQYAAEDSKTVR